MFKPNYFIQLDEKAFPSEEGAQQFQCDVEEWIYTIEFEDGSDIEIAECYLEKYKDED